MKGEPKPPTPSDATDHGQDTLGSALREIDDSNDGSNRHDGAHDLGGADRREERREIDARSASGSRTGHMNLKKEICG
ncbi:hypothetical protein AA105894_1690 [Asaia spathodeae NBRC 105894]|nr:hypothetical protein AA105894_1690 [Asaia spathodeae NBRC 105894]